MPAHRLEHQCCSRSYYIAPLVVDGTFGFAFAGFAVMVGAEVVKPPPPPPPPVGLVESRYLLHKTSVLQPPFHLSPVITPAAAIAVVSTLDFDAIDGGGGGLHAVLLDGSGYSTMPTAHDRTTRKLQRLMDQYHRRG